MWGLIIVHMHTMLRGTPFDMGGGEGGMEVFEKKNTFTCC